MPSFASNIQKQHTEHDEKQIYQLAAKILLMKQCRAEEEAHYDASTAHHRHYAYHGIGHAQRVEVQEVGRAQKHAYEHYAPMPAQWCRLMARGPRSEERR